MNFSCGACGQAYSVADEKVQGRAFRVTCRQCGKEIRVPASRPTASTPARPTSPAPQARPAAPPPLPTATPAAPTRPPAPPPASATGRPRFTPVSTRVAGEPAVPPLPSAGHGMTDDELRWLSGPRPGSARPPLTTPRPGAPPPTDQGAETTSDVTAPGTTTDDVFGALAAEAAAGESPPPPSPAATRNSTLRAVRPSDDSVVESWLSAEPVPRAEPPSRLDDGPDELPPLPGHEAEAAPAGGSDLPVEDGGEAGAKRRRQLPLAIAAAALLVVAGALGAWQLGWLGGAPPAPRPVPPPMAATPPVVPPPAEPAPAPPPPVEPAAEAPAAPPETAAEVPAPAPGPGKRAPGDRLRPSLRIARKDRRLLDLLEKKGDEAAVSGVERSTLDTGIELDQAAVERTLEDHRPAFSACVTKALKVEGAARLEDRTATLMLTVRPNGKVVRAWIAEADLEGQPVGKCLASAARRMVFPAFQGEALDISAPLKLAAIR